MASDFAAAGRAPARLTPGMILARQDRITVWALPTAFLIVLGVGFIGALIVFFGFNIWVPMTMRSPRRTSRRVRG